MKLAAVRLNGLLAGLLLLTAACGGDDDSPTPWPTPTVTPETKLFIAVDGDLLKFSDFSTNVAVGYTAVWEGRFSVGDGTLVLLTFNNVSTVNQHNWVLVKNGAKDAVAARGTAAGAANDWLQPGDSDVIANTRLVNPGGEAEFRFSAPPPGNYQFVCTFPGHGATMFGDFEVTG